METIQDEFECGITGNRALIPHQSKGKRAKLAPSLGPLAPIEEECWPPACSA